MEGREEAVLGTERLQATDLLVYWLKKILQRNFPRAIKAHPTTLILGPGKVRR